MHTGNTLTLCTWRRDSNHKLDPLSNERVDGQMIPRKCTNLNLHLRL